MPGDIATLTTTFVALLAVCVFILGLAIAARKWGRPWLGSLTPPWRGAAPARLVVLERLALEPRRCVYLLSLDSRTLLVGASDAGVTLLAEIAAPLASPETACDE